MFLPSFRMADSCARAGRVRDAAQAAPPKPATLMKSRRRSTVPVLFQINPINNLGSMQAPAQGAWFSLLRCGLLLGRLVPGEADLRPDFPFELGGQLLVLFEQSLDVLPALAEPLTVVGVPG